VVKVEDQPQTSSNRAVETALPAQVPTLVAKPVVPVQPTPALTPTPAPVPTTESPVATVPGSQMALQLSDIPSDYILKDRSDLTYLEMDQMSHDLGWRAGYEVTYYRLDQEKYDMTELRQVIDLYPLANMNKVFDIEEEDITAQENQTTQIYELPCPNMGQRTLSIATLEIFTRSSAPPSTISSARPARRVA